MLASQIGLTKNQVIPEKTSLHTLFLHSLNHKNAHVDVSVICCCFQVSNWFINARVRLWKPMIEEMYKDEFGDSSDDSNPPPTNKEDTTDRVEDSNE